MYMYSKASLNRPTMGPILSGPFSEVVSLGSMAAAPFIHSRFRYQCSSITLINRIRTEAITWLLLFGLFWITNALLTRCIKGAAALEYLYTQSFGTIISDRYRGVLICGGGWLERFYCIHTYM